MRSLYSFVLLVLLSVAIAGCGSGGGSGNNPAPQPQVDISGAWNVKLSTSQAHIVDLGGNAPSEPTQIDIKFKQLAPGSGLLQVTDPLYGWNTGCNHAGSWWWFGGGWDSRMFQFVQGSVANGSVGFQLNESMSGNANGMLVFTGNYNSDGTMSGNLTDACTSQSATWTASRIPNLPQ
jgi:hypothetical protein